MNAKKNISEEWSPTAKKWGWSLLLVMAHLWYLAGWLVVEQGGYAHTTKRSTEVTFVGGPLGLSMAVIFFVLAAIAVAASLRGLGAKPPMIWGILTGMAIAALGQMLM